MSKYPDLQVASEAFKKRNPGAFPEYREVQVVMPEDAPDEPESELQKLVEGWLNFKGFWDRSKKNIDVGAPPMGWYYHLIKPKGNPILLDIVIMTNAGQWFEVELKRPKRNILKHQKQLIAQDPERRSLFYDLPSFRDWLTGKIDGL